MPVGDAWTYLETDSLIAEVRVGSYKIIKNVDLSSYEKIECPPNVLCHISAIWSDGENVTLTLENEMLIVFGFSLFDSEGNSSNSVFFLEMNEVNFEEDYRKNSSVFRLE